MRGTPFRLSLILGLLTLGRAVHAQEISPVFDMGSMAGTMSMGATIRSECARAAHMGRGVAPGTPWCDTSSAGGRGGAFTRPPPQVPPGAVRYSAPPALRQQVVSDFIERVRRHNPNNARLIQEQLAGHDYRQIYDGIVQPYGLAGDDAANALAAYLVLGWMIVHDGREPPRGAVGGVRAQAAAALLDDRLNSSDMRARIGEEFKILFVTVHAGWQSARREGNLDRYAAGIADMFRTVDGIDLRAMQLSPEGFRG